MNVSLTPHYEGIIQEAIASGRYANASEVVRRALELLEEHTLTHDAKLQRLRAAIQEGLDSGPAEPLDMEAIKRKARAEWEANHIVPQQVSNGTY